MTLISSNSIEAALSIEKTFLNFLHRQNLSPANRVLVLALW